MCKRSQHLATVKTRTDKGEGHILAVCIICSAV